MKSDKVDKRSLVSIIIPSYNHHMFIEGAVRSVLEQSYENIELIVIDDGSSDGSCSILTELSEQYGFVLILQKNVGLSATLNKGLKLAKGDFIGFCSSDDKLHQAKIEKQVTLLEKSKSSSFCYTGSYVFDDNDILLNNETKLYNANLSDKISFEDIFTFKVNFPVTGIYRADFIRNVLNGFDESLAAEDYDMNLRIIANTKVSFIDENLYYYRSPNAIGSDRKRPVMRVDVSESHLKTINKYREHSCYNDAILKWNFRRFQCFSAYSNTKVYALSGMIKSIKMAKSIYYYKALYKLLFIWK